MSPAGSVALARFPSGIARFDAHHRLLRHRVWPLCGYVLLGLTPGLGILWLVSGGHGFLAWLGTFDRIAAFLVPLTFAGLVVAFLVAAVMLRFAADSVGTPLLVWGVGTRNSARRRSGCGRPGLEGTSPRR